MSLRPQENRFYGRFAGKGCLYRIVRRLGVISADVELLTPSSTIPCVNLENICEWCLKKRTAKIIENYDAWRILRGGFHSMQLRCTVIEVLFDV